MAFYYAKSGATATGDGGRSTTKRTGAFGATSTYYDGIKDVFDTALTAPVFGDKIYVSHLSDKTYAATTILGITDGIEVICVDDANQDQQNTSATHAKERTISGSFNLTLMSGSSSKTVAKSIGVDYSAENDLSCCDNTDQRMFISDCQFELTGTNKFDRISVSTSRNTCNGFFSNVVFKFGDVLQGFNPRDGGAAYFCRCSLSGSLETFINDSDNKGISVYIEDCDFTNLTSAFSSVMNDDGTARIYIHRLKMASGVPVDSDTHTNPNSFIKNTSLSIGAASDSYFDIEESYYQGDVIDDTAIYRTAGAVYSRLGDNYSLKLSGNSNTAGHLPLRFEHKGIIVLPGAATNQVIINGITYTENLTVTLHFARDGSATDYQDNQVWANFKHSDGVNNAEGVFSSSHPVDHIAAGTDLTNTTSLWTGLGGTNSQMSIAKTLTIGTATGNLGPGILSVDILFGLNDSLWFCPQMDFS